LLFAIALGAWIAWESGALQATPPPGAPRASLPVRPLPHVLPSNPPGDPVTQIRVGDETARVSWSNSRGAVVATVGSERVLDEVERDAVTRWCRAQWADGVRVETRFHTAAEP
jgi:hypothetical protein